MRLMDAFREYQEEEVLAMGGSINTYENYHYACKAFVGEWGNIPMEDITLKMIKRFGLTFRSTHSMRTVRNYTACLRAVVGMCERGGLDVISSESIRLPKVKQGVPVCIEDTEFRRLVAAAAQPVRGYPAINRYRNVLIIKMLYYTGLRISELCDLDISSIRNREFSVTRGKSKEARTCYITPELESLIEEYLKLRTDHNPALFVSSQTGGKRISPKTIQLMFRRTRKIAELDGVHPHTMRHSFCTKLLASGVDIRDTAELMGHQSWNTTKIYTHITNQRLKKAYDDALSH